MLTRNNKETLEAGRLSFRAPVAADGPSIYALIERSKPLDLNSRYCYLILCEHFSATCVVAFENEELVGLVTAYLRPDAPDTLFIWQVAVDASMRGQGVAKKMVVELLKRNSLQHVRHLEATVNPSNDASRALFHSLASSYGAQVSESLLFPETLLGDDNHEQENLIRVSELSMELVGLS